MRKAAKKASKSVDEHDTLPEDLYEEDGDRKYKDNQSDDDRLAEGTGKPRGRGRGKGRGRGRGNGRGKSKGKLEDKSKETVKEGGGNGVSGGKVSTPVEPAVPAEVVQEPVASAASKPPGRKRKTAEAGNKSLKSTKTEVSPVEVKPTDETGVAETKEALLTCLGVSMCFFFYLTKSLWAYNRQRTWNWFASSSRRTIPSPAASCQS